MGILKSIFSISGKNSPEIKVEHSNEVSETTNQVQTGWGDIAKSIDQEKNDFETNIKEVSVEILNELQSNGFAVYESEIDKSSIRSSLRKIIKWVDTNSNKRCSEMTSFFKENFNTFFPDFSLIQEERRKEFCEIFFEKGIDAGPFFPNGIPYKNTWEDPMY